nr:hypothetical protein HYE49_00705 [Mycoplasmopsis bovis]
MSKNLMIQCNKYDITNNNVRKLIKIKIDERLMKYIKVNNNEQWDMSKCK